MVGVGPEGSISALARLSAIDFLTGELLVDKLVLPPLTVTSWRTKWSGITAASMKTACDSGDVLEGTAAAREMLSRHMNGETVLIGHALYHDLKVLEIRHEKVVDSASLVEAAVGHSVRTMLGLRNLCKELLGITIQDDGENGHDSVEDALATREVVLWCMEHPKLLRAWGTKRKGELEAKELKAKTKQELVAKRKQELKANEVEARELDAKELSAKRKIELAVARMTELAAKIMVSDAKELRVATQHMQHAARKVAQENERLRTLLTRQRVLKAKVDAFRRMCEQTGNVSAKPEAKPTLMSEELDAGNVRKQEVGADL
jgi:DNA polymerase III epsilon subunit-like protein